MGHAVTYTCTLIGSASATIRLLIDSTQIHSVTGSSLSYSVVTDESMHDVDAKCEAVTAYETLQDSEKLYLYRKYSYTWIILTKITHVFDFSGNGGWSDFTYGPCNVTCGGGIEVGTRVCDSPSTFGNGAYCSGGSTETRACNTDSCLSMSVHFIALIVLILNGA